ncbi:MAG: DUF4321 domain-containing protein [Firmicutes bacterium]|nr:DUF4321 domain-containing protein [Dethiobacter sp.]MBS3888923.1 DUF4321 domain-containing protein [Bacillota bacterium]MBS4053543.1 DUF4321 domain-containing protein [Thermaerobacter sp.]
MVRSGKSRRSGWLLFLLLIVGVFLGGLLSTFGADYLPFLAWSSPTYGIMPPFALDLGMLSLTFGLTLRLSVAGVLGLILGYLAYRAL